MGIIPKAVFGILAITALGCSKPKSKGGPPGTRQEFLPNSGTGASSISNESQTTRSPLRDWRIRQLDSPHFVKGEKFLRSEDYATALACYTKAIEDDPKNYAAYYRRAWCQSKNAQNSRDWRNAVGDLSVCIANSEECPFKKNSLYIARAFAFYNWGGDDNAQKAIADCTEAIQINSEDSEAYYCRSIAKRKLAGLFGNTTDADRDLAEARRLKPGGYK